MGWLAGMMTSPYVAELLLVNNSYSNSNSTFDLISWRIASKNLPNLATELLTKDLIKPEEKELFEQLSSYKWWQSNVVPTYALSKSDVKDLASVGKDLDSAGATILNFVITGKSVDKAKAVQLTGIASQFIRTGASYLMVKELLSKYQSEVNHQDVEIQKNRVTQRLELQYLKEKAERLTQLQKRFPNQPIMNSNVLDPKDSGAKYLPVVTQLIAVNTDINQIEENLARLDDQSEQLLVLKTFLEKVKALENTSANGLLLIKGLLQVEVDLRKAILPQTLVQQVQLERIKTDLVRIQVKFTEGLVNPIEVSVTKPSKLKFLVGGGAVGFMLGVLLLLFLRMWNNYRPSSGPVKS